MKTQFLESAKFPLSGGYYTIERAGQEDPFSGNKIKVKGTILLPTENEEGRDRKSLKSNLLFKEKVKVLGRGLFSNWGDGFNFNGYRDKSFSKKASKWSEAFKEAQEYAEKELQKLEDALAARAKALEDAEND